MSTHPTCDAPSAALSTASRTLAPTSNRASRRAANRAIYVDFEGRMHQPPVLLGVLHGETYRVLVLDKTFAPLVRRVVVPGVSVCLRTLQQAVDELLAMATAGDGDRRLTAFSLHELQVIGTYVGRAAAEAVASRYLNTRKFFAAWLHSTRPDLDVEQMSLSCCAEALGYEWPEAPAFSPADAIRRLREQLATARRRRCAPGPHTESLWRALIAYNCDDCQATRFLTRTTAELVARSKARAVARHARRATGATTAAPRTTSP